MSQSQRTADSSKWDLNKEMAALGIHLLCFKHKMKNVVWTKGASGLDGKFQSGSEVRYCDLLDLWINMNACQDSNDLIFPLF